MVPPPLARVPQATFDNYRARMRQHFAIPAVLDTTRCIACLQPRTTSTAGEREHEKTGVREACWDLLVADSEERRRRAITRCDRLAGQVECCYVAAWITVSRVAPGGTLVTMEPLAQHIIAVGSGIDDPPNLWIAGRRP